MKYKKIFLLLILCMGIGFAFLTSNLVINGNMTVSGNTWDIYFQNIQVSSGSVQAESPVIDTNKTRVDFTANLKGPGDFYEFTVDAVNKGTVNAEIESIEKNGLDTNIAKFIDFQVTYENGDEVGSGDRIAVNGTHTYKVRVEFLEDILTTDLSASAVQLNLSFDIYYSQADLRGNFTRSKFVRTIKNDIQIDGSIDFKKISSNVNGKGLYLLETTKKDKYPVYYYRGEVNNNNALFAGFCWKIVRTTSTGGTKLIYSGVPDENGYCTAKNSAASIGNFTYNNDNNSLANLGYMYGAIYEYKTKNNFPATDLYGNSFEYDEDKNIYTLKNTTDNISDIGTHHYTCFNATGQCSEISYMFYKDSSNGYYLVLKYGYSIEDAINQMKENKYNSIAKNTVDNWFKNNIIPWFENQEKSYEEYIEDTIWCNDRSFRTDNSQNSYKYSGWNPDGGNIATTHFAGYQRIELGTPSLQCKDKNDAFTVHDTKNGNGALTYPVGLLTSDEAMLAGSPHINNGNFYLTSDNSIWLMTPSLTVVGGNRNYYIPHSSLLNYFPISRALYIRPSISVKGKVNVREDTDGTATNPYEFIVD